MTNEGDHTFTNIYVEGIWWQMFYELLDQVHDERLSHSEFGQIGSVVLITICILIDFKMAVIKLIKTRFGCNWLSSEWKCNSRKYEKFDRKLFWLVWIFKDEVIFDKLYCQLALKYLCSYIHASVRQERTSVSLASVLGARALETRRTIWQTMLQWILPQWVLPQWSLVCHHLYRTQILIVLGNSNWKSSTLFEITNWILSGVNKFNSGVGGLTWANILKGKIAPHSRVIVIVIRRFCCNWK